MPNLSIFHEMLKNSLRMSRMVWKEKRGSVLALAFVFFLISTTYSSPDAVSWMMKHKR